MSTAIDDAFEVKPGENTDLGDISLKRVRMIHNDGFSHRTTEARRSRAANARLGDSVPL